MLIENLQKLFARDLEKLKNELTLYSDEANLWRTDKHISNSAGNLCLHLIGNLNTYIGKELGNTGYVRNRPEEFSLKNIPRVVLLRQVSETAVMVHQTLGSISDEALEEEYPALVFDHPTTTGFLLVHLATHLAYHLGQVNYHRRLLDL